jgi:hypothetical protein
VRPFAKVGYLEGLEIHDEDTPRQARVRLVGVAVLGAVIAPDEE